MYHIAPLSAGNLHFLIGVFLHFITGADTELGAMLGHTPIEEELIRQSVIQIVLTLAEKEVRVSINANRQTEE